MFESLLLEAIQQPVTDPEPLAPVSRESQKPAPVRTKRNHPGRIPIPDHLERVEIVLDLPEEQEGLPSKRPASQTDRLGDLREAGVSAGQADCQRLQTAQV